MFSATCQSGSFMNVSTCEKVEPPHVCDPLKPCSEVEAELQKKPECREPPLCIERIKNNLGIMKEEPCDKTK
ncbi:Uncharacterized protein OBRU01_23253 [Operophtera brumata]|uniref:Uncharacterized protein n=1 Tax=Operophtera brumata TaxID=104452 RepID=A0A0L7KQ31_OPEBR|nr:Uncharacterized protein OBRU01_23253 [Operophtera brumata]